MRANIIFTVLVTAAVCVRGDEIDLLQRYPTQLAQADTRIAHARPWKFSPTDIFEISGFHFEEGNALRIDAGASDVGIGHCADGIVWALVVPKNDAQLTRAAATNKDALGHIWLRFHPSLADQIFPPSTVTGPGNTNLYPLMRAIAAHKFRTAFHSGDDALIPAPADILVDADTRAGVRRFFVVDRNAHAASYVAAFEQQGFKMHPAITRALAEEAFDALWEDFDNAYAMFALRPDVDWNKLHDEYQPRAVTAATSDDFAAICAEMLRQLRDVNIFLDLAGTDVPVFQRAHPANSNPAAHKTILGSLNIAGRLQWAITTDKIGFLGFYGWDDDALAGNFQNVLEKMRDTRGLIIDVRWNAGGSERPAQQVAARFLTAERTYAFDQFRDGPAYTNLTKRYPRKVQPSGPWRYDRPVILLLGPKCAGSGEAFVGMMLGATNVITMGEQTAGSSGNPQIFDLPLAMRVSVPRWIDYKADGTPLDGHGYEPQVPFIPAPGAYGEGRDDLLQAACDRLRK